MSFFSLLIFFPFNTCYAQATSVTIQNPLTATSIEAVVNNFINFLFYIAIAVTPLMVVIAAFYILTSGGDPRKVETGKSIIFYAIVGFLVVMLAKGIVAIIRSILGLQ
jgi:magnesium-transporting ATPase (P-type)